MIFGARLTIIEKVHERSSEGEMAQKEDIHINILGNYVPEEATPSLKLAIKIGDISGANMIMWLAKKISKSTILPGKELAMQLFAMEKINII
ncbi:MAG: hypothetical protein H7282_13495 [Cytophagaceae bacterium]|nr:hypothetical protein [Cytophagaceae bacterium]